MENTLSTCEKHEEYAECTLCPRNCKANRYSSHGFCNCGSEMLIARIAPHLWEEPFLSGQGIETPIRGSGTVFFCGCNLGCIYCQNFKISRPSPNSNFGKIYSPNRLADEFIRLQETGVHNINLVTAGHFLPSVAESIRLSRKRGLRIPTVYNSSGYEKVSSLRKLEGLIDIYLPDLKYFSKKSSADYSAAPDYPEIARAAIEEMYRQTGKPRFDSNGFMQSGTAIRHLILPGCDFDSTRIIAWIHENFGSDGVCLSIMNQYTPVNETTFPELSETLPRSAYIRVVEKAQTLGFKHLYTQEDGTASESFIPNFST